MVGKINIQKYGIKSISVISEASWSPRVLIKHFDNREFTYTLSKEVIEIKNSSIFDDFLEKFLWDHIKTNCVLAQRKEKLEKIEIQIKSR